MSDTSCLCYLARLRLASVLEVLYGSMKITIIGVVGVLAAACDAGLTGPLRPVFAELVGRLGFRISRDFIDAILEERGE